MYIHKQIGSSLFGNGVCLPYPIYILANQMGWMDTFSLCTDKNDWGLLVVVTVHINSLSNSSQMECKGSELLYSQDRAGVCGELHKS